MFMTCFNFPSNLEWQYHVFTFRFPEVMTAGEIVDLSFLSCLSSGPVKSQIHFTCTWETDRISDTASCLCARSMPHDFAYLRFPAIMPGPRIRQVSTMSPSKQTVINKSGGNEGH